jgi:hypothetical protein
VTAGAGNDSLVDSPTAYGTDTGVGGEVRGNYATFNPLNQKMAAGTTTLSNGNLTATNNASSYGVGGIGTVAVTSGKWYCEVTATNISATATSQAVGIVDTSKAYNDYTGYWYRCDGQKTTDIVNGTGLTSYGNTYTTNDVIGIALDMDAGEVKFYKNGTVQNSGTAAYTGLSGALSIAVGDGGNTPTYVFDLNAGQRAFAYTAPSGFKALCTTNLPTPTIGATSTTQANDYFNVVTYTGTGSEQNITVGDFQPDFVWLKTRSAVDVHSLADKVRGDDGTRMYILCSNLTGSEADRTEATTAIVKSSSWPSNGFRVGTNSQTNGNGTTYVGWQWNAGGSNATNTSGTITSTVRANTTSGFSIISYTGNGANGASVGHGLGVKPTFWILKQRTGTQNWLVSHSGLSATDNYLILDSTSGQLTNAPNIWTADSSKITFTTSYAGTNNNGSTYILYAFAPIAGYSAFGSYTGNGSADGPFVYLGFRPEFVMIKRTSAADNWVILDAVRSTANPTDEYLWANLSNAEVANLHAFDFLSNGFKIRNSTSDHNTNGSTYIYACFAESPFKYALAR